MASTDRNVATTVVAGAGEDATEDLMASASSLWPPRTVVKRHRKKATLIWVFLLVAFCVYVGYVVWDTVDARTNPAASVQLKQSPFTFPDVAVCATFLNGCLSESVYCFEDYDFTLSSQEGFMEVPAEFVPADFEGVTKVRQAFPHCAVMPLSKLTVNETGVDNGDVDYFWAYFNILWYDDPDNDFNATAHPISSQSVSAHFIDIDLDVDQIGEKVVDVHLPYERIFATKGDSFTTTRNHMVISMAEFSGITKTGHRKERERTYSQTTTSAKDSWYWSHNSTAYGISALQVEMLITKFEYTTVVEVDPVDMWAIIGAIAGVWQFVAVAFGVFFIFSEKQPPDKKMRDFYDTVVRPAVTINRRLSSITSSSSSRSSQQDIEIDAADEDLPPGWVKKQRRVGSVYYFHRMTGVTSASAPHERDEPSASTGVTAAPRRQNALRSLFRVTQDSQNSGIGGSQSSTNGTNDDGSLPPGWLERTDVDGRLYYMDTVSKMTQWNRPVHSSSGGSSRCVQAVDIPVRRIGRGSGANSSLGSAPPPTVVPPIATTTAAATGGGVVGETLLPPNWEFRITQNGRTYYANTVTRITQWETPCNPV